ncbi:MAG: DUF5680 domain-containing protein, partial [Rickettsiales bacterium]|nr:DUF5680 domain-containing protein [Rickettsiales bacterium]
SRPESKDLRYEKGDFIFHDSYFGGERFIGTEAIYYKTAPVWGMSYYGWTPASEKTPEEVFAFLRKVLLMDTGALIPVRGPRKASEGYFEYENSVDGDMENFQGREQITYKGQAAHACRFIGGAVK